ALDIGVRGITQDKVTQRIDDKDVLARVTDAMKHGPARRLDARRDESGLLRQKSGGGRRCVGALQPHTHDAFLLAALDGACLPGRVALAPARVLAGSLLRG